MAVYNTRSLFDIAQDADTDTQLYGLWHRHSPIEFCLMQHGKEIRRFMAITDAMAAFDARIKLKEAVPS